MNEALKGTVVASDPPEHTKLRRVLSEKLSPGGVAHLQGYIADRADELVASLVEQGQFDAAQDLAAVFPVSVVADLIGLPDEGREELIELVDALSEGFGPPNERMFAAQPKIQKMFAYLAEMTARERLMPGSMGMVVFEAADRGEIDPDSCIPLMNAYVSAGMDTTVNAIGTAVYLLASDPEQWARLRTDPSLIRSAGNEVLRYESPVQAFARVTEGEQTIGAQTIPDGERVLMAWGAGNRDERRWRNAEAFDVTRNPIDHLGFGHGIHRCAGAALARLEIEAVLTSLTTRCKEVEIIGPPERRISNVLRGLRKLPVSVTPA